MSEHKSLQQVFTRHAWLSGADRVAGHLTLGPEAVSRRCGLRFSEGQDDLDRFREAAVKLSSGRPVLLVNRPSANYGLDVLIDVQDQVPAAMTELTEALRLLPSQVAIY
jgi:hypothetical protein